MKTHLFRWWRRTQLDIELRAGFLSLGLDRRTPRGALFPWRLIAYYSPDATPIHPRSRGLKGWGS
jgi:hypothetical protein